MTITELSGPKQIEDAAIEYVIDRERAEGREALDTRHHGPADVVSGDRVIEVKACGTSSRGYELWLECRQYVAARDDPEHFWLYLVENVAQGDPGQFRLIRLGGARLQELLDRAKEHRHWTVPVPVAVYDSAAEG